MIPSTIGAVTLGVLAALNLRLGRSALYPPAQFALFWSALLALSAASSTVYFPLSVQCVSMFCAGAVAFSAGGLLAMLIHGKSARPVVYYDEVIPAPAIKRFLTVSLVTLLALFPFFWSHILSLADVRFRNVWWGIRSGVIAASELQGQKTWEAFFYDNITVAAILLALIAMVHYGERGQSRVVAAGLVAVATIYNLATGSKSGAATALIGTLGIRMMKRGRVSAKHVLAGVLGVLVMYVPLTLLRAGDGNPLSIAGSDLRIVGDIALLYTAGPLTAFDAYLNDPSTLTETWTVSHFFLHAANRMGFDVIAPSTHVGYVMVSPGSETNVYTMYFAYYPEFGWIGVIFFSAFVGYIAVWIYEAAILRRNYIILLYGLSFHLICTSGFNEGLFMGLNFWIKAAICCVVLNAFERRFQARSVEPDLDSAPQELAPA